MAKKIQSGLDRISSLSDDVLCRIISLLPAKDAVRTCILSKRWRYLFADLFASISNLDFDFENNWEGTKGAFLNFVDRVLLLNKRQSIDRFRLYPPSWFPHTFDPLRVEGWIHSALRRSIEEIDLSIGSPLPNGLPASLFTCKKLVVLKLSWLSLRVPASVHLPSLKVFHIKSCRFDDHFGEWLSTGCPVLEELVVDAEFRCPLYQCKLNVSNSMLKKLTIEIGRGSRKVEITINAPSLVCLQYYGYDDNRLAVINVPSLTEASIDFWQGASHDDLSDYLNLATDLMTGISNIDALSITYATLDDLNERMVPLPSFQNLTYLCILEYNAFEEVSFLGLHHFLSHSDFLETLVFEELPDECESIDWHKLEESRLPCLLFQLKTIEIFSFKGGEVQLEIIKYFLKNARVLENLTINMSKEKEVPLKMIKEIRKFPRISEECQITIVYTIPRISKECQITIV